MTVTRDQAQMLATLARACRPNGAKSWDTGGIMAALEKVRDRQLSAVVMAVIRAASDQDCDNPGVIPSNGSHWAESAAVTTFAPQTFDRTAACGTCSMSEAKCRTRWAGDHEYEPLEIAAARKGSVDVPRVVEALKAEVVPIAPPPEPKTLDDLCRDPRVQAVRNALRGIQTPQMRETEPELAHLAEPQPEEASHG